MSIEDEPVIHTPATVGTVDPTEGGDDVVKRGRVLRRFLSNKLAVAGLVFIILLVLTAIFAEQIAPKDPNHQELLKKLRKPGSSGYSLGSDEFGRDVLSRLIFGSRVTVRVVVQAMSISLLIGVPLGLLAGFLGKWIDAVLNRITEAVMSVPYLILAFAVIAALGPGLGSATFAVGLLSVPGFYRVMRASTQDVRGETYVEASRAIGCTTWRTLLRHVLPNAIGPLVVQVALGAGRVVTAEAALSFLGLSVKPPTASWGGMLTTAVNNMQKAPFLVYYPGFLIVLTVLAFTFIGDGLRNALGTTRAAVTEN